MRFQDFLALVTVLSLAVVFRQLKAEEQQQPANAETKHENQQQASTQKDPRTLVKDVQHIKDHLKGEYGFTDEQAEKYLQQYDAQTQFFLMHDYDNNTKLDGLELLKSMSHHHDEDENNEGQDNTDQTETLVEFVDMVMKDQDVNDDGFIDYPEYISYYTKFDKDQRPDSGSESP